MSMKAVIAAVLLAILLGSGLYLINRGSGSKAPPGPAVEFDPTQVTSIRFAIPGQREAITQRSSLGGWSMPMGPVEWPLNPSGPADLLASLRSLHASSSNASTADPANPIILTLTLRDSTTRTIRIASEPVGGAVAVRVDDAKPFTADKSILDAASNPRQWRVNAALPGLDASDLSQLTITAGASTLAFGREGNKWVIQRPISARADQRAVTNLIAQLSRSSVERFIDEPTTAERAASGLDKPRLIITAERGPASTSDAQRSTRARELYLGGPAAASTTTPGAGAIYAAPDRQSTTMLIIPGDMVGGLATMPGTYLASTATDVSPADVAIVSLRREGATEIGYRRQQGNWTTMNAANAAPVDGRTVDALLTFLTTQPGQPEPVLPGRTDGLRTLTRITLIDIDGETRDVISVGYNADGIIAMRSGNLVVLYPNQPAPEILSLPRFADLPPEPGAPTQPSVPMGDPVK